MELNQHPSSNGQANPPNENTVQSEPPLANMYKTWFLDYASYVILDRAVPSLEDGLKPVQRRILHALKAMDDGRFHKVANAIGQTMQFHPHGDASIYEALVNLGQKDLMIETQGNWGDVRTGDSAAAARYIEARLSKFALEIAFNKDITEWQRSYDGRKQEPVHLPVKFPLLLAQGVEGIAVGLSTKILPHNFIELIKASIQILRGKKPSIYPDFATGGLIDVSNYNDGKRGGRVRVRSQIEVKDKKTLVIRDTPYGVTTNSLIDSIIKANDKNKIKIKRVVDNTAKDVEIIVELPTGVSPDVTVDALYAFSNCEVSISPNCCLIVDNKPMFLTVGDLLQMSTEHTLHLLKKELEFRLKTLLEKLHFASLEKIFIEKRIYRRIENCETFEAVIETVAKGLKPHTKHFIREVTRDDILRLIEIRIKRISKYDSFKADEVIKKLEDEIAEIKHNLANLTDYAIDYFKNLLKVYGKGKERKTEIRNFDTIQVAQVAIANQKLYVNRKGGFIGYGLKKDEFISECSDIDDVIVFRKDGKFLVTRISEKTFVGKDIIYTDVWKKGNDRKVYHFIYYDAKSGNTYVKRFNVTAITRDREYDLTQGHKGSKMLYFSAHPNSEAETVTITLSPTVKTKNKVFDYDFSELAVKGRSAKGNILSRYGVKKIVQKEVGGSTLGGLKIWLDESVGRLNTNERGQFLGEFDTGDTILVVYKDGNYQITDYELTNRYEMKQITLVEKFDEKKALSVVYYNSPRRCCYVKRFVIGTSKLNQKFLFIDDNPNSNLLFISTKEQPVIEYTYQMKRGGEKLKKQLNLADFMEVKGWRVLGNKLTTYKVNAVEEIVQEEKETPDNEAVNKANTTAADNKASSSTTKKNGTQPTLFD